MDEERAKQILKKFDKDKDLFNWCEEYKTFVSDNVLYCVSSEWDYMLKHSYEDSESPVCYEDLVIVVSNDDIKERILDDDDSLEDEYKEYCKGEIKDGLDLSEDFLTWFANVKDEGQTLEDIKERLRDETEIYEWWLISDPLKYRLEQEGQIFLNDAWGRQTSGQSISLDYCVIHSFIDMLKDRYRLE